MGYFTAAQAAALAETTVRIATLVELRFFSGPEYLWNGFGNMTAGGNTYKGLGGLGQVDGLEDVRDTASQQVTLTLSGVDATILGTATGETSEVEGRQSITSLQLFDDDWQLIGSPSPVFFGLMQPPRVSRSEMSETGGSERAVVLPVENLMFGRSRPAAGRYTDREQQTRHPLDKFCEYVSQLVHRVIVWPSY